MIKHRMLLILFSFLTMLALAACSASSGSGSNPTPTPTTAPTQVATATPTPTATPTQPPAAQFQVTSIDMAVNPTSIAGIACGTSVNVVYTATFHVTANSPGGTVQFLYTVNNGRSSPSASVTFAPGETSKAYMFNWSGTLEPDNVYPGLGGVVTSSPNALTSPTIKPSGTCALTAPLQVTSIDMAVSPTSIAGMACGTYITVTYTATFHVAANSPGGTVQFRYSVNNGRNDTPATLSFAPGESIKTYTFTWAGNLPSDHTYPGNGVIVTQSPNSVTSQSAAPSGQCS